MPTFSERQGIIKSENLDIKNMPIELKNRLWNLINGYIESFAGQYNYSDRDNVIEYLWDKFFKETKSSLKGWDSMI
jgi:hypothetical protein